MSETAKSVTVRDILVNEKYAGDLLLQKFFHEDFRTKKKRENTGEFRKVYVKNSHDAIIDCLLYTSTTEDNTENRQNFRLRIILCTITLLFVYKLRRL